MSEESKPDCSRHKKQVAGITDMKALAEMIGDLHYETMANLFNALAEKLFYDFHKDEAEGRIKLAACGRWLYYSIHKASAGAERAWQISKPFMQPEPKKQAP